MHDPRPGQPIDHGAGDEPVCNLSANRPFAAVLAARCDRRQLLLGGLGAAVTTWFGSGLAAAAAATSGTAPAPDARRAPLLGFTPVPLSDADTVVVPPGYSVQVLIPWGTALDGSAPVGGFDPLAASAPDSAPDQARQVGSHHDGMHFFPLIELDADLARAEDGLLVVNHEYVEPRFMHAAAVGQALTASAVPVRADGRREPAQVAREINAHGVTVVRVWRGDDDRWVVVNDRRNRRITAATPMTIAGPVRGSDLVVTRYSPDGTATRGTINNCAHGVTPWRTFLTCEENWAGYFVCQGEQPRELARYGVASGPSSRYGWELAADDADATRRFDCTPRAGGPTNDYRNEPNGFGWVVEIDPFDPTATPVKRTALGRFAHEGVVFHPPVPGRPLVCYSGDDAKNEYIYKFVSAAPYRPGVSRGELLDTGTLYVARFNDDGSGDWLPLVFGVGPLQPQPIFAPGGQATDSVRFRDQADVLVNTRTAADLLGATPMDRPEWGAIDPTTGLVYFSLTNNSARTAAAVDAANPRAENRWGHIIRWREAGDDPTATGFQWDHFLLAGPADDSRFAGRALTDDEQFINPDGLWFDPDGRLWIQTDIGDRAVNTGDYAPFGNNQMLCCDPAHQDLRRFLTGPRGQEITGVITTPDQRTLFVNVQHPGASTSAEAFAAGQLDSTWPGDSRYPRSATLVITKDDGGIIGT